MKYFIFALITLASITFAQINTTYANGESCQCDYITTQYDNGIIFTEIPYSYGKEHGIEKIYYETGELHWETNYAYGYKHGTQIEYLKNGTIANTLNFENDKLIEYIKCSTLEININDDNSKCIDIPKNSHKVSFNKWNCNDGYFEYGNKCHEVIKNNHKNNTITNNDNDNDSNNILLGVAVSFAALLYIINVSLM